MSRNGDESVCRLDEVYSPGRRRKKNASSIMSAMALVPSAAASTAKAVVVRYKTTWKGMGLTRSGGGSSLW
jgi:hypothetical protein